MIVSLDAIGSRRAGEQGSRRPQARVFYNKRCIGVIGRTGDKGPCGRPKAACVKLGPHGGVFHNGGVYGIDVMRYPEALANTSRILAKTVSYPNHPGRSILDTCARRAAPVLGASYRTDTSQLTIHPGGDGETYPHRVQGVVSDAIEANYTSVSLASRTKCDKPEDAGDIYQAACAKLEDSTNRAVKFGQSLSTAKCGIEIPDNLVTGLTDLRNEIKIPLRLSDQFEAAFKKEERDTWADVCMHSLGSPATGPKFARPPRHYCLPQGNVYMTPAIPRGGAKRP